MQNGNTTQLRMKEEILHFATACKLEEVILREVNQKEKDKYQVILLMWSIKKQKTLDNPQWKPI